MTNPTNGQSQQATDRSERPLHEGNRPDATIAATGQQPPAMDACDDQDGGKAESMIAAMAERMWGDEQPQGGNAPR
ncbi:hypothetical protein [Cognatiluteimonas telluris]|jgi:hypothetical protein|uniref:hypothetical protein n=1 Tax=Cognatiluteimonas telluris TaxID=1104775 RepID=UPI00140B0616|nr:hypothetical protein [Lysobacter telluris]